MNAKKQQSSNSSESSTTSSSNSSSSSSSSSGSDSSSSDSEGSSSSQSNNKSGAENEKSLPKRSKPAPVNVKAKKPDEKKPQPIKPAPVKKPIAIYSSESDEAPPKPSPVKRRLSTTKPKVTATVPVSQKSPKANSRPSRTVKNAPPAKSSSEKATKKPKARSIFSPDNSSESENDKDVKPSNAKGSTRNARKSPIINKKENDVKKEDRRITRSSASGSSSDSTDSSSDSDSSDNSSSANTKSKLRNSEKQDSEKTESENSRNQNKSKTSESSEVESNKRVTRKLTRSSSARRSKHLIGKAGTDTESEPESKSTKSAGKKGPKGPINKNKNSKGLPSKTTSSTCDVIEARKCPLEGCDSLGHLGGSQEKHFTIDACPMFHNKTIHECKKFHDERMMKEEERRKALMSLNRRSPKHHVHHLGSDQRSYQLMVKEIRSKFQEKSENDETRIEDKDKEPLLTGIASDYDLKLFQEAQAAASEKIEDDLKALPNMKQTKYIEMGKFEMEVWYQSPYPEDYARLPKLYLCEYCLKYMKSRTILKRHIVKCVWRHPPGEEVYRKDRLSVWEVDGKRYKQYCQNLCLLAKFFLDHKTLYYDVEPFLFYVMTISDSEGCHTVGYFSKEKNSFLNYNVSCILTLPPYQRQGYGRLLIDFSYLLTKEEGKIGSPEKPLSDLGLISYRSYWKDVLIEYLCKFGGKEISIKDISQETAINSYDIVSTLQALGMMKYWKGKHIILKKQDEIEEYNDKVKRKDLAHKEIDKKYLKWIPFTPTQPQNSS